MDETIEGILPDKFFKALREAKITTPALILKTRNEKFRKLGFSPDETQLIRNAILPRVLPQSLTAAECITSQHLSWKRITTGCCALDRILGNGISCSGITEIFGESGSGKSQICLQLGISVQLPDHLGGLERGAVYISSEGVIPSIRLCQISEYFKNYYKGQVDHINFTDNIFMKEINTVAKLLECVNVQLPLLMAHNRIGIIIIDSVGALFRVVKGTIDRAYDMRELVLSLLQLSHKHHCAVVCVNQITSIINKTNSSLSRYGPSLGSAWSNLVSTRLEILRTDKIICLKNENSIAEQYNVREMKVLFAPDLKQDIAKFLITSNGVSDLQ